MGKKYNPADFSEQAKAGINQVALAMDKVLGRSGKLSADFSPLSVSLASYWDNQFAELPMRLQDEADKEHEADEANEADKPKTSPWQHWDHSKNKFFKKEDPKLQRAIDDACRGLWWDLQSPEGRIRIISKWDSRHYPETSVEEFVWMAEKEVKQRKLWVEIKRWEEMNTQGIPSEEKIKNEMLDKLRAELAEIKQRLSSPPDAEAGRIQAAPAATKKEERIPVAQQQGTAILTWLKSNGHDPLKLPLPDKGKSGVKKDCRDALCENSKGLFSSPSVFDTAWDRLRANKEIRDAK